MESPQTNTHHFDATQQEVIEFTGGQALVLAAPGCGKTHILTQRIVRANQVEGIPYKDMLCLTFTNRAARSMCARIEAELGNIPKDLFVGNLHRFCIRFLFENNLLPLDVSIIDEFDQEEIIRHLAAPQGQEQADEQQLRAWAIKKITDAAAHLFEQEAKFPADLHLHKHFDPQFVPLAQAYRDYKAEHGLMDFDDILLTTYQHLSNQKEESFAMSRYPWIQVDEVQDLNPLQLAIVDIIAAPGGTVVYLGDERQAIYSFMGTSQQSVVKIGSNCENNVFHLANNYRSPKYLLDMLNDYAQYVLQVPQSQLPTAYNALHIDDGLTLVRCDDPTSRDHQADVLAMMARQIYLQSTTDSIGILVRTNQQADEISHILSAHHLSHLSITRKDAFKGVDFKTLMAHFSLVINDTRIADWMLLLAQSQLIESKNYTRRCLQKMRSIGLLPTDFFRYDNSSYCIEVADSLAHREIVVFDTETTGLDFFNNDIIQIAAVKLRNGQVVEGSEFDIIIETDQEIPAMLGDLVNPMVEEYQRRQRLSPAEAFEQFIHYVGDAELVGHNVNFDLQILLNNLRRRA
ncbi:MAG: UvrD-helicase domain-containing protein, partial [Bacteroidaceae bacterium]|nr:UvrD-helicase domain-containing protein [Bacteroidaceae bacterium]